MQAVLCKRYGGPEVLEMAEVEQPEPKKGEVLIRVHATTVTVADHRVRSFTIPTSFWIPARLMLGIFKPRQPILGTEVAGEVVAVGEGVHRFEKGDAVFAATLQRFGGYAEYVCLPENSPISVAPSNVSLYEAAALPVGARTALHFLQKAGIQQGQKILVYGASGSVGSYAVQLARHYSAQVTGVCSAGNAPMVSALGAQKVLDYKAPDFEQQLETYDIVFVAVDKIPFSLCQRILKPKGIYCNVTTPIPSPGMLWASLSKGIKLQVGESPAETADDLEEIKELVEQGVLRVPIDRSYTLKGIVEAHAYVDSGRKKGNVSIEIIPSRASA